MSVDRVREYLKSYGLEAVSYTHLEPMRNYAPAGVQVVTVEEGSPAEAAGLQAYDIITEINGERIYSNDELIAVIDQFSAGDTVELTVCRYYNENGTALAEYEELTVEVELQIID